MLIDNQKVFDEYLSTIINNRSIDNPRRSNGKLTVINGGSQFRNITITDVDLSNSILTQIKFKSVQFENCNFNESIIEDCKFSNVTFKNCNFDGAQFADSNHKLGFSSHGLTNQFHYVSEIHQSDFISCSMNSLKISFCRLSKASFTDCFILGLYLYMCTVTDTTFEKSNLEHSIIELTALDDGKFIYCNLNHSFFYGGSIQSSEFLNSCFSEVSFRHATVTKCIFENCYFKNITTVSSTISEGSKFLFGLSNNLPYINGHQTEEENIIDLKDVLNTLSPNGNFSKFRPTNKSLETSIPFEYQLITKEQYSTFLKYYAWIEYKNVIDPFESATISNVNSALKSLSAGLPEYYNNCKVQFGDSGKLKIASDAVSNLYNPFPGRTIGRLYTSMANGKEPNSHYPVAQKETITRRNIHELTVADILYAIYWMNNKNFANQLTRHN